MLLLPGTARWCDVEGAVEKLLFEDRATEQDCIVCVRREEIMIICAMGTANTTD